MVNAFIASIPYTHWGALRRSQVCARTSLMAVSDHLGKRLPRAFFRNRLTYSSWESKCCVPAQILGPEGYLSQHQRNLAKMSLITSGSCDSRVQGGHPLDLS